MNTNVNTRIKNSKKVLIFIVEGESDKIVLDLVTKILKENEIVFHVVRGDISSDDYVTTNNVESKISRMIEEERSKYMLKKSDIFKVVHIFDMDGAYIFDSLIKPSSNSNFVYKDDGIYCSDFDRVKKRNRHKREIMDYLLSLNSISNKYKYECYYFSCNLDHALYDERNLEDNLKTSKANSFKDYFCDREKTFVDFLELVVSCGVPNTYTESWDFIKNNDNSLQRHTNFHLFFKYIGIIMKYKKYVTRIKYNFDDNVYYGKIEGIDLFINFQSKLLSEVECKFHKAVDDYLSNCQEEGITPAEKL